MIALRKHKSSRSTIRQHKQLSLLKRIARFLGVSALLFFVNFGSSAELRERDALERRVTAVRDALKAQGATGLADKSPTVTQQKLAQWYNWPNWNNWYNWPNWPNWNNWGDWWNY